MKVQNLKFSSTKRQNVCQFFPMIEIKIVSTHRILFHLLNFIPKYQQGKGVDSQGPAESHRPAVIFRGRKT